MKCDDHSLAEAGVWVLLQFFNIPKYDVGEEFNLPKYLPRRSSWS